MKYQITLLLSTFISLIQSEVLFVLEHFRHGATGPSDLDSEGKDLMNNTWDKTEVDELTPIGVRMQYILGLYFADRYKHLIPDKYDPKAIYVSSVNDSKAIQSAIAHTSAFYFGKSEELNDQTKERAKPPVNNLNETIIESLGYEALPGNFQTIPIHIFHPYEHDFLLQEENGDCKAVKEIRESNLKTKVFKKIKEKFENEILSIWENSEIIINKKASTFEKIKLICENFFVNDANNNSFTPLKEGSFNNNETKFNDFKSSCNEALSAKLFNYIFNPEQIYFTYVTQSKQMRKMLDYMDKRRDQFINQKEDDIDYTKPKIVIWSGLDSTVAGTQMFFNELHKVLNTIISDKNYTDKNYTDNIIIYPTYASSIFIELNWNESCNSNCSKEQMNNTTDLDEYDSCFYVQYFINGISNANYTYDNFTKAFRRIVVDDDVIDNYCNFKLGTKNNSAFLIVCIVFVVIILIGSVCSSTYFYNGIRKNENKKSFVGPLHAV